MKIPAALLLLALFASCKNGEKQNDDNATVNTLPPPAAMNYSVVAIHPHDTTAFTEGLLLHGGAMYESTGMEGASKLVKVDPASGKALQQIRLTPESFGEGISIINNKIYQLTWQQHKVYVYDMNFKKTGEMYWPYEGWGMTTDGKQLIISTGGSNIYFVNPETFKIERTLGVSNNNGYVDSINELEYVNGKIYANIWQSDYIIRINPQTGYVEARADLSGILQKNNQPAVDLVRGAYLNGIAYDSTKGSFYVTGKYWPAMFEVKFN